MVLRVLDLCAGTGSATAAFRAAGHEVITVDNDPSHHPTILCDLRDFAADPDRYLPTVGGAFTWCPDIIWASPPCTVFSMAGSGRGRKRWHHLAKGVRHPFWGPRVPADDAARLGCELVLACIQTIATLKPRWWWLENPQGGLQTMGFMQGVPGPVTVSYCQYGDTRQKRTVLWGVWPEAWEPRPACKNGMPCHEAAPRGSRTGTQGLKTARERAMVPIGLSQEILAACQS